MTMQAVSMHITRHDDAVSFDERERLEPHGTSRGQF